MQLQAPDGEWMGRRWDVRVLERGCVLSCLFQNIRVTSAAALTGPLTVCRYDEVEEADESNLRGWRVRLHS